MDDNRDDDRDEAMGRGESPDGDFLEVRIENVSVSNLGFIIFLKPALGFDERVLPIFIGANEAHSIAVALNKQAMPRPLTHDLLKNVLETLDCELVKVQVTELADNTFFARIHLRREGFEDLDLDARPSDAIALALRYEAPIYVHQAVFEAGALQVKGEAEAEGETETPEDTGVGTVTAPAAQAPREAHPDRIGKLRAQLQVALAEERYEDAARIRDELKRLHAEN